MLLIIRNAKTRLLEEEVTQVRLPGAMGNFQVWVGHHPLLSTLEAGRITYQKVGKEEIEEMTIEQGIVCVTKNRIAVFLS